MPECSLVNESKVRACVVKCEPGAQVRAVRRDRVAYQELSAHAQMGEQRILADGQPQVLSAPPGITDLPSGQRRREVIWTSQVPARGARMEHLDVEEPAPTDMSLEAEPDALHLWQLWHRSPLGLSR